MLADAGYATGAGLAAAGPPRVIALGQDRDQPRAAARETAQGPPADVTARQAMAHRLRTGEGQALWHRRGATWNQRPETSQRSSTGSHAADRTPPRAISSSPQPPSIMEIYRAAIA